MISARMGSATAAAMVLLGGCGSVGVALGMRTRLDKLPVTAVSAKLSPQASLTPGKSGRLVLVASGADGKTWTMATVATPAEEAGAAAAARVVVDRRAAWAAMPASMAVTGRPVALEPVPARSFIRNLSRPCGEIREMKHRPSRPIRYSRALLQ